MKRITLLAAGTALLLATAAFPITASAQRGGAGQGGGAAMGAGGGSPGGGSPGGGAIGGRGMGGPGMGGAPGGATIGRGALQGSAGSPGSFQGPRSAGRSLTPGSRSAVVGGRNWEGGSWQGRHRGRHGRHRFHGPAFGFAPYYYDYATPYVYEDDDCWELRYRRGAWRQVWVCD
jgi:hypothetical protein